MVAVWPVLKIQAFAARCFWEIACSETVLIGNLPTSLIPFSYHAFHRRLLCSARPRPCLEADDTVLGFDHACPCCLRTGCTRELTTFCGPEDTCLSPGILLAPWDGSSCGMLFSTTRPVSHADS